MLKTPTNTRSLFIYFIYFLANTHFHKNIQNTIKLCVFLLLLHLLWFAFCHCYTWHVVYIYNTTQSLVDRDKVKVEWLLTEHTPCSFCQASKSIDCWQNHNDVHHSGGQILQNAFTDAMSTDRGHCLRRMVARVVIVAWINMLDVIDV